MISIVRIFGAPVIDPPGKAARTHSTTDASALRVPRTVDTSWWTAAYVSIVEELGNVHRTGNAHPRQIVARQVDDHQVLGAVLLAVEQILPQGRVLGGGGAARPRPLDGFGLDHPVRADPKEPFGGRAENGQPGELEVARCTGWG